jgi:hypothetical protein
MVTSLPIGPVMMKFFATGTILKRLATGYGAAEGIFFISLVRRAGHARSILIVHLIG